MAEDDKKVAQDEERRQAVHQDVKASVDDDVKAAIERESTHTKPEEAAQIAGVAHELKQESVQEAVETERETKRGRSAARISQFVDYLFWLIYGIIALQFMLRLLGARPGSGFVQFIAALSRPLLAPFERIVPSRSVQEHPVDVSDLLALVVYMLIHLAINGVFRLVAHRKVEV
jgi:uncharacterized protein YggT (Ycf19 family)